MADEMKRKSPEGKGSGYYNVDNSHSMEKKKNLNGKGLLREIVIILASAFAGSFGQICIMIPNGLTSGGMPGIVRIITHYLPLNYSLVYYICAMLVVVFVFFTMGWVDVRKIIALSIAYPVIMYFLQLSGFELLVEEDRFLASIGVGVLYGVATGIGYIGGYSSGGTDSISRVIKYRVLKHVPVSHVQFVIDGTLIVISAFVFDRNIAMYALVSTYVTMKVTEAVMMGLTNHFVEVNTITTIPDQLIDYIMNGMHRGVTSFPSVGEYTGIERKSVQTICTPRESLKLKAYLADHDPNAFITVSPLTSVWGLGKGFSDIHEVDNT